jgi:hypothetical protein
MSCDLSSAMYYIEADAEAKTLYSSIFPQAETSSLRTPTALAEDTDDNPSAQPSSRIDGFPWRVAAVKLIYHQCQRIRENTHTAYGSSGGACIGCGV